MSSEHQQRFDVQTAVKIIVETPQAREFIQELTTVKPGDGEPDLHAINLAATQIAHRLNGPQAHLVEPVTNLLDEVVDTFNRLELFKTQNEALVIEGFAAIGFGFMGILMSQGAANQRV